MATGYTSKLSEGEQSFEEFALQCARAFGACVMQRDDPMDNPPELQEPSKYYQEELIRAQKSLAKFNETKKEDYLSEFNDYLKKSRQYNEKQKKERLELKKRYQKMLKKVKNWEQPSADHKGLKDFMIEQLESSIAYDCDGDYYEREEKLLEKLTFDEWYEQKKNEVNRSLEYFAAENKKEVERAAERNKWILALYESLKIKK